MPLPVALQLYSVRDDFANDMPGTLKKVKELGYDGVELAGFGPMGSAALKTELDKLGLKCISAHVSYDAINEDPEKVFAEYKSVGCEYIAIPWLDMKRAPGGEDMDTIIPHIIRLGKMAKEAGLTLLYHNHDFEFRKVGEAYGLDLLYEKVPPEYLETQMDTCWVKLVGINPAEYLRKYKGRAPLVHLKDFTMATPPGESFTGVPYELIGEKREKRKEAMSGFQFKPVGSGVQDFPSVLQAATEIGTKWVIVEYDQSPEHPPLETARISREYLKSLGW
jgi:sugar phosphate isomerase/epimerase